MLSSPVPILCLILLISCCSPVQGSGSAMTEGDVILKTDQLRNITAIHGEGISVGVISNGVKHLSDAQKSGDLPYNVTVIKNGKFDEGTAMLEIIHDIAPGASLYYADFGNNEASFIEAIDKLIAAGCNIIVEDVGLLEVPYFEDGKISAHVDQALSQHPDLMYISAAGNNAEYHYQEMFTDGGGNFHSFAGSTGIPVDIKSGGYIGVVLQWDDSYSKRDNIYSLYLYDRETGEEIAVSERTQSGEQRPFEKFYFQYIGSEKPVRAEIRVKKSDESDPKNIELMFSIDKNLVSIPAGYTIPTDSIIGQSAAVKGITVAAIPVAQIPVIEKFSSRGSVTITHPEAEERRKPDITGVNAVEVSGAGGFPSPFTGTSAAAPHIAGLIALVWSQFPDMTRDQLKEAMIQTATRFEENDWSPVYGYGLPDAVRMYQVLQEQAEGSDRIDDTVTPQITPGTTPSETPVPQEEPESFIITKATVITRPGYYSLLSDILDSSETIIRITASDVILDGMNHQVEGFAVQFGLNPIPLQRGLVIESSDGLPISNITIRNLAVMGTFTGITAAHGEQVTIEDCRLPYNSVGLLLSQTTRSRITQSTMNGNARAGIILTDGSSRIEITSNELTKNLIGMIIDGSSENDISGNTIQFSHQEGLLLTGGASSNVLANNTCLSNGNGGIILKSSLKNTIVSNHCEQNTPPGIYLEESSENEIRDNVLTQNVRGMNLYYSDTNTITGNIIDHNKATGIMFQPSGRNIIQGNRIIGNEGEGILISSGVTSEKVNLITDNYLENTENIRIQDDAKPNYQWFEEKTLRQNIIGGPYSGGNAWVISDESGYSQTCTDADDDGICDQPYLIAPGINDAFPLKYSGKIQQNITGEFQSERGNQRLTDDDLVTEGLTLFGRGAYEESIEAMDRAIALSPTKFQAWRVKSLALSKLKRTDEAIEILTEALKMYQDSIILWYTLGDLFLLEKEAYHQAIEAYNRALKIDPKDTHTLVNLAYALDKVGNSTEALDLYLTATGVNPSLTDAWVKAGNIETRAKHYDTAIQYYDKALSLDQGNAFTWNNKGYAWYLMGNYSDAITAYLNAIRIDSTYTVAWTNLGNAYLAVGDQEAANEAFSHT